MSAEGLPTPQRWWAALAIVAAVLDGSIANVALPTLARERTAGGRGRPPAP
ncbi:MAG: hypothetical protein ACM31L_06475 [Actinomycetota bacterium]